MKKIVFALLTGVMTCSLALTGCLKEDPNPVVNTVQTQENNETAKLTEASSEEGGADADQEAADEVAALIDAIYVQVRRQIMIVDGEKYMPTNTEGDSVFETPVLKFDEPIDIIGDTVAMSKPHEVEYTLTFHSDTLKTLE